MGWDDPLEKGMATHSSILAYRILWTEEPGRPQFMGLQRVRHNWVTNTSLHLISPKAFPNFEPVQCSMSGSALASWPAYRFLRRQVKWGIFSKNCPQFVVIHTVKGISIVIEVIVDVFLEFSCFSYDPAYVGNLISGSSDFSKSNLSIWNFSVHILLMPSLKDFEHYLASM